jgi:hypothetical protein
MASTADIAFARMAGIGPSPGELAKQAEVQREIQRAMVGVLQDARYNPQALVPPERVMPAGATEVAPTLENGGGWYEPRAMRPSAQTDELIKNLADDLLAHGEASVLRKGEGK